MAGRGAPRLSERAQRLTHYEGQIEAIAEIEDELRAPCGRDELNALAARLRCIKTAAEIAAAHSEAQELPELMQEIKKLRREMSGKGQGVTRAASAPQLPTARGTEPH